MLLLLLLPPNEEGSTGLDREPTIQGKPRHAHAAMAAGEKSRRGPSVSSDALCVGMAVGGIGECGLGWGRQEGNGDATHTNAS